MTSSLLVATAIVAMLVYGLEVVPDLGVGGVLGCSLFDHDCGSKKRSVRVRL